uniref:HIRAN domain-containing protein n=1 Tax=Methylocaldum sp. TaxID=1969727 RepID=UPI00321F6C7A
EFAWPFLRSGDRLALIREPGNRHDAKAVRIEWEGLKLGYLPRHENHAVAQLLDRDEQLHARILAMRESSDPWERIEVAVELAA